MKYQLHNDQEPIKTKIDYAAELNSEQLEVINHAAGPVLILAGAGSGKTRTLVYLTAYLLEHKIDPKNIMLVTFTNKAAREMLNRVELLLHYRPQGLWGGTFHHLANIVLRKYAKLLGFQNNFSILDDDDAKSFLKSCLAEMRLDTKKEYFPKPDVIHAIMSFHQNSRLAIAEIIEQKFSHIKPEFVGMIERIFGFYQGKKQKMNALDFDDLLSYWHRLLAEHPAVRQALGSQLKYILVDEYQDTNTVQAEIIEMLASVNRNVVVVGDDSQSIYSFRAANIQNILDFPKRFNGTAVFKLETNYRSTPQILRVANQSIKNNRLQYEKNLKSVKPASAKPGLVALNDSYQQAEFISQRVLDLQAEGHSLNSMAVLFRSAYQALELELELNKRSIPYEMRGGIRFFEQAHIKDVIAHLRIFNNPKDELSWKRVLMLYPGIGPAAAQKIWEHVERYGDLITLLDSRPDLAPKPAQSWDSLQALLRKMTALTDRLIPSAIAAVLDSGYKKYVEMTFDNPRDRLEDLEQLANFAVNYKNLDSFLSEVTLSEAFKGDNVASAADTGADEALVLSTIHQAKGLEWKAVFVLGLCDGQFPHHKVFDKPHELEEERRLFYVAVTRAQDELYLTYPIISSSYLTGQNINRPSTFIREIDEDLLEKWDVEGGGFELPTITYDDGEEPGILDKIRGL